MKIKLLKTWSGFPAGHVFTTMHRGMALTLVRRRFAEVTEDDPPAAKKATKKKTPAAKKATKKKTPAAKKATKPDPNADPNNRRDDDNASSTETQPAGGDNRSAGQRQGRKKATQHRGE